MSTELEARLRQLPAGPSVLLVYSPATAAIARHLLRQVNARDGRRRTPKILVAPNKWDIDRLRGHDDPLVIAKDFEMYARLDVLHAARAEANRRARVRS